MTAFFRQKLNQLINNVFSLAKMISIIIPVFNAEKYICQCIDSILPQTNRDWELILINDGSTDQSGKICDDYACLDSRVRVFHKENSGVSSARNYGIENAKGEWITFVDADDYLSKNYCEAVYDADSDIVITGASIIEDRSISPFFVDNFEKNDSLEHYKCILQQNLETGQFKTPWGKFIKFERIVNIRFATDQKIGEDSLFMTDLYHACSSIEHRKDSVYYWRKGNVPDAIKYKIPIKETLLVIERLFKSYESLKINCIPYERHILRFFFEILYKEKVSDINRWFANSKVSYYNDKVYGKEGYPKMYYSWMKYPYLTYCYVKLSRLKSFFPLSP